jgi:pimeloyl-ACP methyl ester carboxylesterase
MKATLISFIGKASLLAAAALLAACSTTTSTPSPATSSTPIILVHGAWMGASAWDKVAANLRSRGFQVTAVELPGHGNDNTPADKLTLAGYVDAVGAKLPSQGKAILVGHSMAGMVISGLAEQAPQRVSKLVYVAAYLPRSGESLYQLSQKDADSVVPKYWHQDNPKAYSPATIKAEGIAEVFCADCSPTDQQWLRSTHKAEAVPPLGTPVTLTAGNFGRVPKAYVHTTQDKAVSYALQKTMLANAGGASEVMQLDSSHAPMLSQPLALADSIAKAARTASN